ncbi:MAG: hypothetical protein Kow0054_02310 [Deferrisoma sp.]
MVTSERGLPSQTGGPIPSAGKVWVAYVPRKGTGTGGLHATARGASPIRERFGVRFGANRGRMEASAGCRARPVRRNNINPASIQAREEIARAWGLLPAVRECGIRLTLHPALSRMDGTTQEL